MKRVNEFAAGMDVRELENIRLTLAHAAELGPDVSTAVFMKFLIARCEANEIMNAHHETHGIVIPFEHP